MRKTQKNSPGKRKKKNDKPTVGCGLKQPVVVRHNVPARSTQLSQQSMAKFQASNVHTGPPTIVSSMRRGIGSGNLHPPRQADWPGLSRYDEPLRTNNQILVEQRKAREMLQTLSNEVNGLNKDRENLRRATQNADLAFKKTIDFLSPVQEGAEGVRITTDGRRQVEAPEEVFLRILSPSKQHVHEGEGEEKESQIRTPTRKINYDEPESETLRDSERVLEMSPPLCRYNPSIIQHTFELNLDGITLQELDQLKKQNEARLKAIEARFFETNKYLEDDLMEMTEFTKDDQYIIKSTSHLVQVPINSLVELNADMLNFDTNASEPEEQTGHKFSKRLIYELKFEKYLKSKIKDEIIRREQVRKEKYIPPEELIEMEKQKQIEEMVRTKLDGKTFSVEDQERIKLQNQARIDAEDEYLIIIKQIFNDLLADGENLHPNTSDDENYEQRPVESVEKDEFVRRVLNAEKAQPFLHLLAREPHGYSEIPAETYEEVLRRIQKIT